MQMNPCEDLNVGVIAAGHPSVSVPVKFCCFCEYTRPKLAFGPSFPSPAPNIPIPMSVYSLVTQFDQVQVCGGGRQAADVQVGFAELLQACAAAVAAAAGTGRSHGVRLHTGEPLLGLRRS